MVTRIPEYTQKLGFRQAVVFIYKGRGLSILVFDLQVIGTSTAIVIHFHAQCRPNAGYRIHHPSLQSAKAMSSDRGLQICVTQVFEIDRTRRLTGVVCGGGSLI